MIPDKIYIRRYSYGALLDGYFETPQKMKSGENIEYIRKDTLLRWAKEKTDKLFETELDSEHDYGKRTAFLELIDKLNSL